MAPRRQWPEGTDPLVKQVDAIRYYGVSRFKNTKLVNERIPQIKDAINERFPDLRSSEVPIGLRKLFKPIIEKLPSEGRRQAADQLFGIPAGSPDSFSLRLINAHKAETGKQLFYDTIRLTLYDKELVEEVTLLLKQ